MTLDLADFDEELKREREVELDALTARSFTASELEALKAEVMEAGRVQGLREGYEQASGEFEQSGLRQVAETFEVFAGSVLTELRERRSALEMVEQDGVEFVSSVLKKLLPKIIYETHYDAVMQTIRDVIKMSTGEASLVVYAGRTAHAVLQKIDVRRFIPSENGIAFSLELDETKSDLGFTAVWGAGSLDLRPEDTVKKILDLLDS